MNDTLKGFFSELEKIGYSLGAHRELVDESVAKAYPMRRTVRDLIAEGSVGTDVGSSFPLLPWADLDHAFPSRSLPEVDKYIKRTFNEGIEKITDSIESGSGTDGTYGLMQVGRSHHTLMDLGAHRKKLEEMGAASQSGRSLVKEVGHFGGWESLLEHLRTGYVVDELVDKGEEGHKTDQASIARAHDFGKQILPAITSSLESRGHSPEEAHAKATHFLATFNPSTTHKTLARIWNFSRGIHND